MVICIMIRYYFDIKIYIWEHLEIKVGIKIIQYVCIRYITEIFCDIRNHTNNYAIMKHNEIQRNCDNCNYVDSVWQ